MVAGPGAIYSHSRIIQNRDSCHFVSLLSFLLQWNTPEIMSIYHVIYITCPIQTSLQPWKILFSPLIYRRERNSQASQFRFCCCDKILRPKAIIWRKCMPYYNSRLQSITVRKSRQEMQRASHTTFTITSREM